MSPQNSPRFVRKLSPARSAALLALTPTRRLIFEPLTRSPAAGAMSIIDNGDANYSQAGTWSAVTAAALPVTSATRLREGSSTATWRSAASRPANLSGLAAGSCPMPIGPPMRLRPVQRA